MNKQRLFPLIMLISLAAGALVSPLRGSAAPAPGSRDTATRHPVAGRWTGGAATDWWAAMSRELRQAEYHVTWQDRTSLPDLPAAYQAPNRAQDLRVYFTPRGVRVTLRAAPGAGWMWGVALTGYGRAGAIQPLADAQLAVSANQVAYQRGVAGEGVAPLLFLWTPTHFWSLAIVYRDDYARGGFPMLPAQTSPRQAAAWVLVHTLPTALAALLLAGHPALGWLYFLPVGLATLDLAARNLRLLVEPTPKRAFALFKISNLYLALVLLLICVDAVI